MKIHFQYLLFALALASRNAGADQCLIDWNSGTFNFVPTGGSEGEILKSITDNGGILWTQSSTNVQSPGIQVVTDGDLGPTGDDGDRSCIMAAGVNPADGSPKQCTDERQTSKRVKVYTNNVDAPVDLHFSVGPCNDDSDSIYRFFLKYENLSPSRISSFRIELGSITDGEFSVSDDLQFTDRDGGLEPTTNNDLAAVFAFGLFGETSDDFFQPFNGYYDPTGRAIFTTSGVGTNTLTASVTSSNFQDLYAGAMGNWIPKSKVPCGYFFEVDEGEAPTVGDWDGKQWVTRRGCTDKLYLENLASIYPECDATNTGQPVPLSEETLEKWYSDSRFDRDFIEDLGNVNVNAHFKIGDDFSGDLVIRITPTKDSNSEYPWTNCPVHDGGMIDDPHVKTWNGTWYDYHGECDLVLLQAPYFHHTKDGEAMALKINVRTKARYDYSFIESAVLQLGESTLQVDSFGQYFLDGVSGADLPATFAGFPVIHSQPNEKQHVFKIDLGHGEDVIISTFKDMVSVKLDNADESRFHASVGLMGEFGGKGRLLARDGVTIVDDPNLLGQEWQVREEEDMLFQVARAPQHPQKCILPDPDAAEKNQRLGHTVALKVAEQACAHWTSNKAGCISDVMKTGDVDLASAAAMVF